MSSHWESLLTPQEAHAYAQFFSAANGGKSAVVSGPEAVAFFARSGIPNEILSDIWETADRDNLGYLTPETFSIALKLVACAQHGHEVAEPILSSAVPLPQFEGFNPDATTNPNSRNDIISPAEREKYLGIFRAHQPVQGVLDAEKAKNIFNKSKLPNDVLAQIWNLADLRKAGNLNQTEFVIAMHYIAKLMDRSITTLPAQLPAKIYGSAAGSIQSSPVMRRTSMSPAAMMQQRQFTGSSISSIPPPPTRTQRSRTESIESLGSMAFSGGNNSASLSGWDVTPQEKAQYDLFFNQIDIKHVGAIQGSEAVEFFKNSRLPDSDLARIWDLADMEQNGQLTRDEFAVAMHLIQSRLAGKPLPNVLPKSLIPPSAIATVDRITSPQQPLFQSPPSMTTASSQPLAPPNPPSQQPEYPQEDLLGDFGDNEELTTVTNSVNQLQYQIKNVQSTIAQVKSQKNGVLSTLEQSQKQKQTIEAQTAQYVSAQQAEGQRLIELQNIMKTEEPEWTQVQQEHDAAQKELEEIQQEVAQMKQTLEHGRTESERLRHRVHDVQQETAGLVDLLERLRIHVNKQRSVTADSTPVDVAAIATTSSDPSPKLTFDDIFSPSAAPAPAPAAVTPKIEDDFDAIFAPQPTTAEKRQPPPPPPPSRRTTVRRQEAPQTAKKARAPPPPPPSAAVATTTTTTAAAAAAISESDESETDTTASSDNESSSEEDAKSPKTETSMAATAPEAAPEISVKNDQDTKPLEQSAKLNTVETTSNDTATETTTAEQGQLLEKPVESKVDEPVDDADVKSDIEKTQSMQEPAESEVASAPVTEVLEKTTSPDEVPEPEVKATPDNDTEDDHRAYTRPDEIAPSPVANVAAETNNAPTGNHDVQEVEESSSRLAVDPPKEEDRVTSEILADKSTPGLDQSTISSTPADSKQDLTEAKPQEADEEASLQDRNEEIVAPVSSSSSQSHVKDIHTSETQANQLEADPTVAPEALDTSSATKPVSTSKEDTTIVDTINGSELSEEKQDDQEQKTHTDAPIPNENVADTEIARGEGINDEPNAEDPAKPVAVAAAATVAPVIEGMTALSKEKQDSTDDDVSTKQGEVKNEATTGVEGQGLDTGAQESETVRQGDNTNVKDKDTESDFEDEFLSIDGDDAKQYMDADNDRKTVENDNIGAKDTSLHDDKENKPMDEQTDPRMKHNQDKEGEEEEEEKALEVNKERAESTSSPTNSKEEGGERGLVRDAHYIGGDSVTDENENRPEGEPSTHDDETPKNFAKSDLMTSEPKEHVEEESSSNPKEPEQGSSAHDDTANEEEQQKEQPVNEDFDAVFMERPNDKERSSSDEGGGESFEIISSATSPNKDHQAPPAADEFDAAFASELQDAKVVNDSSLFNQDDFDAAFAGELTDAKVVQNDRNDNGKGATTQGGDKLSWASNFGGFNFDDFDTKKNDDEWDSIFGGDESKAGGTEHVGFQDAFSASFNNNNNGYDNTSSSSNNNNKKNNNNELGTTPASAAPATNEEQEDDEGSRNKEHQQERGIPATVGSSNLDQLVIMGFDRDLAKEALDRYDQDLEKATNFLLDLAAK